MAVVARLVTHVELRDADARSMSVSARLEAVLQDGRRVTLLDDRGWTESIRGGGGGPGIWADMSIAEIEATARTVVGPDEPFDGRTQPDMERDHWAYLTEILRAHGVRVVGDRLRELPHEVMLGGRLLALLRGGAATD